MTQQYTPEHVRAFLAPFGVSVVEISADTSTAPLAAKALGTSVGSIAKSLLFMVGSEPVLVIASGDKTVDEDLLSALSGSAGVHVRLAKPSEVLSCTGYRVGGVPPVALRSEMRVLMDRTLLRYDTVYAAAGAADAIFPIAPDRLRVISGAEVVEIVRSQK